MSEFTFLTEEQVFGDKQLDILKKYGTKAAISDYAILLGGSVFRYHHISEGNTLKNRIGWWWTKSLTVNNKAWGASGYGIYDCYFVWMRDIGARPVLPYSSIQSISTNKVRNSSGILEVEYG